MSEASSISLGAPARMIVGNINDEFADVFPAMQITSCPILYRYSAITQPVLPDDAF